MPDNAMQEIERRDDMREAIIRSAISSQALSGVVMPYKQAAAIYDATGWEPLPDIGGSEQPASFSVFKYSDLLRKSADQPPALSDTEAWLFEAFRDRLDVRAGKPQSAALTSYRTIEAALLEATLGGRILDPGAGPFIHFQGRPDQNLQSEPWIDATFPPAFLDRRR